MIMAVQYVIYKDQRKNGNGRWYGRAVHSQTVDVNHIAERIQHACSMTRADVKAVIDELVVVMKDELQNSNKVKLDGFGTFWLAISSEGAVEKEDYSADYVRSVRCRFLAEGKKSNGLLSRSFTDGVKVIKAVGSVK